MNGRLSEAYLLGAYTSLGSRLQYTLGVVAVAVLLHLGLQPRAVRRRFRELPRDVQGRAVHHARGVRHRHASVEPVQPDGSRRFGEQRGAVHRGVQPRGRRLHGLRHAVVRRQHRQLPGAELHRAVRAYVSDNSLFGYTGPIAGRRYRVQVQPVVGGLRWTEFSADYRRYVPLLFNFLTLAWRTQTSIGVGPDEMRVPEVPRPRRLRARLRPRAVCGAVLRRDVHRPVVVLGHGNARAAGSCSGTWNCGSRSCGASTSASSRSRCRPSTACSSSTPVWRGQRGQSVSLSRPDNYDQDLQRYLLRSYGMGIRMNLFGYALLRADYAIPLDRAQRQGYWVITLGPSF